MASLAFSAMLGVGVGAGALTLQGINYNLVRRPRKKGPDIDEGSERAWRPSNQLVDVNFGCKFGSWTAVVTRIGRLDNVGVGRKIDKACLDGIHHLDASRVVYKAVGGLIVGGLDNWRGGGS